MSIGLALGTQLGRTGGYSPGGTILHRSTFTAPDGTALGAYAPEVGNPFTADRGTFTIQGNAALAATYVGGNAHNTTETGRAGVLVESSIIRPASPTGTVGLVLRRTDSANYWIAYFSGANVFIFEVVAGAFTNRASTAFAFAANTTYPIAARAQGTTITAFVNGIAVVSYASAASNLTATRHGVYADGATNVKLAPFVVTAA